MNLQQVFEYEGKETRVVMINDEPWWVAKDVCDALEIGDASSALRRLDDDEKGADTILTLGGEQELLIVNESGLYTLILTSRKPEAKKFKKWITGEVIPTIRKEGRYDPEEKTIMLESDECKRKLMLNVLYARREYLNDPSDITLEVRLTRAEKSLIQYEQQKQSEEFEIVKTEVNAVKEEVDGIKKDLLENQKLFSLKFEQNEEKWKKQITTLINALARTSIVEELNLTEKGKHAGIKHHTYVLLEGTSRCKLNSRVTNLTKRLAATGMKISDVSKKSNKLAAIFADKDLRNTYQNIVKDLAGTYSAKYQDFEFVVDENNYYIDDTVVYVEEVQ